MNFRRALGLIALGVGATPHALAASLDNIDITRDGDRFHLVADSYVEASPAAIRTVLLDFEDDNYARISDAYLRSEYLEPDSDGTPIVHTLVEGCVLLFCRTLNRVERLEIIEPLFVRSRVVPEQSDFNYAMSEWTLEPEAGGTRMTYRASVEPSFWFPPFVRPSILRRILMRSGEEAIERIEELALELDRAPAGTRVGP